MTVQLNQTEQISLLYADICHCWFVKVKYIECSPCHTGMVHCKNVASDLSLHGVCLSELERELETSSLLPSLKFCLQQQCVTDLQ